MYSPDKTVYYSTTKLLTKEKPILEQKPEYKLEQKLFWSAEEKRQGEGGLRTKGLFKKSYKKKPLISVVTIVFNGEKYLEQTIKSVLNQSYDNLEYIIIDGGSTDGTLDIIKKYEEQIDYWISESDRGIYDAMNKGLQYASGDFIAFLNADDYFKENIIDKVVNSILTHPEVVFFYGDVDLVSEDQHYIRKISGQDKCKQLGRYIPHQSCFIQLDIHRIYQFDISYKIIADRLVIAELFKNSYKDHYMNFSVANFREGGISAEATSADKMLKIKELDRYRLKYYGLTAYMKEIIIRSFYKFGIRTKLKKIFPQVKQK